MNNSMEHTISQYIPPIGESLALYKGKEVVERIGEHIIKDVVTSILCGGNVRYYCETGCSASTTIHRGVPDVRFPAPVNR